jgi:uncharacterized protein
MRKPQSSRKGGNKTAIVVDANPTQKVGRSVSADGLENCISGMGTSLDKRSYTKYSFVRPFSMQELDAMYRQSWLCKRIVNIIPDDMTRSWREFNIDNPKKLKKIQDYEKQIKLRMKFVEALRYSRLYGGCIVVMITDDMDFNDPDTCSAPLDLNKIKKGSLKSLLVYDRWRVYPDYELVSDIESPDFESPMYYKITSNPQANPNAPRIHHSRIIRFDGELIPYIAFVGNARWHDSVLQHVYDSVLNSESAKQAVSSMMDEANVDVYMYSGLRDSLADRADGEELTQKRLRVTNTSKSIHRAIVLDADDKYEKKSNQFSNLDKILHCYDIDVCGAAKTPYSKLFYQQIGGLSTAGEDDLNGYYDDVVTEQENRLRPALEKLDQVLIRSVFGNANEEIEFTFPSLWQESDLDNSTIDLNNANRDAVYLTNGVLSPQDVADKLLTSKIYNKITAPEKEEEPEIDDSTTIPDNKKTINKKEKKPKDDKVN